MVINRVGGWRGRCATIAPWCVAFVVCAFAPVANGDAIILPAISDDILIVHVSNDDGEGGFVISSDAGEWDPNAGEFHWSLPEAVDIYGDGDLGGELIASIWSAQLDITVKPEDEFEMSLNVSALAGAHATDFEIASARVMLAPIPEPIAVGRAIATISVTDVGGDGACLVGGGSSGLGAYRCYFNGYLDEGELFSHLLSVVCVGEGGGTADATQFDPLSGYRPYGDELSDISAELAFTLTAGDFASATTQTGGPAPSLCAGDVNGDWVVDVTDLSDLLDSFGAVGGDPDYNPGADIDGNGVVDTSDLQALLSQYGVSCLDIQQAQATPA